LISQFLQSGSANILYYFSIFDEFKKFMLVTGAHIPLKKGVRETSYSQRGRGNKKGHVKGKR
jgi:hypothetical protein